jgi:hypothetical protein
MGNMAKNLPCTKSLAPSAWKGGNFITAFHAEKKKPNSDKTLNFHTLECKNCKRYAGPN